jgi:hypothetical protein
MSEPEGATPAMVTDHEFFASPWWARCNQCRLSEAAHIHVKPIVRASRRTDFAALTYACPDCVTARDFGRSEPHKGECHERH